MGPKDGRRAVVIGAVYSPAWTSSSGFLRVYSKLLPNTELKFCANSWWKVQHHDFLILILWHACSLLLICALSQNRRENIPRALLVKTVSLELQGDPGPGPPVRICPQWCAITLADLWASIRIPPHAGAV
ncbi:hypothetical protein BD779DRAFT_1146753 [Infundibulicybe gibba]|nr:hypothetical protein BD779DRAFT_1146753 [Infundibulicybe gibba]